MAKYYGVERSQEYLEHFGILGMKWGRRKNSKNDARKAALRRAKRQKWWKGFKEDSKYAAKAAALSLVMGPSASFYVNSQRIANDPNSPWSETPKKRKTKRRR